MEQDERIRIDLMTPLRADFISDEQLESDEEWDEQMGFPLDGADLAQYKDSIQEMVDRYNASGSENGEPCNLMQYFHGSASIADKVESAVVSVKESEGVLYGCTTLQLKELLEMNELTELCKYITGQYSDGWGEGFEQCDIKVEDGTINVHFWQNGNFRFQEAPAQESQIPAEVSEKTVSRPKLKLLGHDGNIFSILGDARRLLRANGQRKEADEMTQRVENSGDYYKALGIISEYVETELSQNTSAKPQKSGETKKSVKENRER